MLPSSTKMGAPGCSLIRPNRLQRHAPAHHASPLNSFPFCIYKNPSKPPFATPFESAFTDTPSSKPFIICIYKNTGCASRLHLRDTGGMYIPPPHAFTRSAKPRRTPRPSVIFSILLASRKPRLLPRANESTPVFPRVCRLFCTTRKAKCPIFKTLQSLCPKYQGYFPRR
jgi:hypothetical protein